MRTTAELPSLKHWIAIGLIGCCTATLGSVDEMLIEILEQAREESKSPGVRAAVRQATGEINAVAVGFSDREAQIALDDSIPMPGGSTGKIFVAALTMLLIEDNTLSLDDHASKWLGDTPWYARVPNADAIQIKHLLSHSAGVRDYPNARGYMMKSIWRAIRHGGIKFTPEELIEFTLGKKPLFDPGSGFAYSDIGYLILGKAIESASGHSYYELLEERIIGPQGLDDVLIQDRSVLPGISPGYMRGARNLRKDGTMKIDPSSEWTGGGLALNPTTLVKFLSALTHGKVVSHESFQQMLEGGWRNPSNPSNYYGFGLFVYDNGKVLGHAGLWPGYRTEVLYFADSNTTIAVQMNRDGNVDTHGLIYKIAVALGITES